MSLLMEALKKAEQAKRKSEETPAPAAPAFVTPPTSTPTPPVDGALTLELAPAEPREPKQESAYVNAPVANAAPPQASRPAQFTSIVDRVMAPPPPAEKPPVESAAPSPQQPAQAPEPPAAIAASVPTPPPAPAAKPQTQAASPAPNRAPQRAMIPRNLIVLAVLAVVLLSGGGYWYYDSMSNYMQQQATMALPPPVPETVIEPEPTPAPVPVAAPRKPMAKAGASKPALESGPAPTPGVAADAPPRTDGPAQPVPAAEAPPAPPIEIARDHDRNETYAVLQQAYAAYLSGDDVRAQVNYARVLGNDENNRDALLGLAAIAIRNRDMARAQEIYLELLTLDPKDSVAQAGLAGVTAALDPVAQEARIKTLLDQEPNAPHLLFAYASLLMQQQRWSEAARALQSAQQSRNEQPDYAYNLAVSLDHLGQAGAALRYYRRALELAQKQPSVFSSAEARRRIAALEGAIEGAPQ